MPTCFEVFFNLCLLQSLVHKSLFSLIYNTSSTTDVVLRAACSVLFSPFFVSGLYLSKFR